MSTTVACSVRSIGYDLPPPKPEPVWPTGKRKDAFRPRSEVCIPAWMDTVIKDQYSKLSLRAGKCHTKSL
jgi:hypothetical protein